MRPTAAAANEEQQQQQRQARERRAAKLREATRQQRAAARARALAAVREARARGGDAREAAAAAVASAVRPESGGSGGGERQQRQEETAAAAAAALEAFAGPSLWDPDEWADLERELVEEALAEEAEEHRRAEDAALEALIATHDFPSSNSRLLPLQQTQPSAEEVAASGTCPLCGVRGALAATAGGALACSAFAFGLLDGGCNNGGAAPPPPPCRFAVSGACGPGSPAPTPQELAEALLRAERAHAATGCSVSTPGRTLMAGSGGGGEGTTTATLFVSCSECGFLEAAL